MEKVISEISIFKNLSSEVLSKIRATFKKVDLEPETSVFVQGKSHELLYLINNGTIAIYHKDVKTNEIQGPAALGFTSLFIPDAISTSTLITKSLCEAYSATRIEFEELAQSNPDLSRNLMVYMAQEIRYWRNCQGDILLKTPEPQKLLKMLIFDSKPYDRKYFGQLVPQFREFGVELRFIDARLDTNTVSLAQGAKIVCVFVNDDVNSAVVEKLHVYGVEMIALRCAGFDKVSLDACESLSISVARVPAYSPYAVAEHAITLIMSLNRKINLACNRTRIGDFSLSNLLTGFDMHGKNVGVIGTGKIGKILVNILLGFGCNVFCYDVFKDNELAKRNGVKYLDSVDELLPLCDVISLHSPLLPSTTHMINSESISKMKKGVMLINTSRGGLIDSAALINGLKSGQIGFAGLDVYEGESEYFFQNWSDAVIKDDELSRLLAFNNVIVTSHQAFFTHEALVAISETTMNNVKEFIDGKTLKDLTNAVIQKRN